MAQTILIETNEDLKKIFALHLGTFVGTNVILRKDADDATALLKILPQISLIITRAKVGQEETALRIYQFLRNESLDVPMIVIGDCPLIPNEVLCLKDPISWEQLVRQAANVIGVTLKDGLNRSKTEYVSVGLHYFYDIQRTPCDVFIRIKKGPEDFQFIKRIHSNEAFDKSVIKRYEDQGLQEFYIPKAYIQYFTTFVTNSLLTKLEQEDLTLEDRILTTASAHEIIRDSIRKIGLDQANIDLSDASISSMVQSIRHSPEVTQLLKFLFSNKVSYAYQHCHLLALMCHYIFSRQSWYKPEHLEILSFASFFSDMTLRSPHEMQISSMKELSSSHLSDEEKKQVLNHAFEAQVLASAHPDSNEFVKMILLQSHGKRDGIGFEDTPTEDLHPLSKIFIIADTFVKTLLNPTLPNKKEDILALLRARFTEPSYQKIIKALEQKYPEPERLES